MEVKMALVPKLFIGVLALHALCVCSAEQTECDRSTTIVKNIMVSCSKISTGSGYNYTLPPNVTAIVQDRDCEQAWYNEDEFLSDGQLHENHAGHGLVINVNINSITVEKCIELQLCVTCHRSGQKFLLIFIEADPTPVPPASQSLSHIIPVPIIAFIILFVLITGYCIRQRIKTWCCCICCQRGEYNSEPPACLNGVHEEIRLEDDPLRRALMDQTAVNKNNDENHLLNNAATENSNHVGEPVVTLMEPDPPDRGEETPALMDQNI